MVDGDETLNGRARIGIEHHTADDTLLARESGTLHTNKGASGTVVLTLPAALAGMHFKFAVRAAFELRINPAGTELISLPSTGVAEGAGEYITANAVGETVEVVSPENGVWVVYGFTGTWTGE